MKNPDHHDLRYRCVIRKVDFGQMGAFVWNPGVIRKVDFGQMGLSGGQVSSER